MHPRDVYLDREREIQVREGLGWVVSMHPRDVYLDRERDTSQGRVGMGRLHAPKGRVPG